MSKLMSVFSHRMVGLTEATRETVTQFLAYGHTVGHQIRSLKKIFFSIPISVSILSLVLFLTILFLIVSGFSLSLS